MAVFTGMRASELRGLTWSDVGLKECKIHVRQLADKCHVIGMPKSDAGQRAIPLTPMVANALKNGSWRVRREILISFPEWRGQRGVESDVIKRGLIPAMVGAGLAVDTGKIDDAGGQMWTAAWSRHRKQCKPAWVIHQSR